MSTILLFYRLRSPYIGDSLQNMDRSTQQHAETDVITVKVPEFWPHAAAPWFSTFESQFHQTKITSLPTKYTHLARSLTADMAKEVADALSGPLSDSPYDGLKKILLQRTQPTTAERVRQLLTLPPVGEGMPS